MGYISILLIFCYIIALIGISVFFKKNLALTNIFFNNLFFNRIFLERMEMDENEGEEDIQDEED